MMTCERDAKSSCVFCPLSVYLFDLQGTRLAWSLDLFASTRVVRTQRLFSSFSITIFSHLFFSHLHRLRPSFSTFSSSFPLIIQLTTTDDKLWVPTPPAVDLFVFWCFSKGQGPTQAFNGPSQTRVCQHFISFFEGFVFWQVLAMYSLCVTVKKMH